MINETRIARVTDPATVDWSQIRSIYDTSFPASERDDFETVFLIPRGQATWVVSDLNRIVGFAVIAWLPNGKHGLLEYAAVAPDVRSLGLGGRLLDAITDESILEGRDRLVLEVEDPAEATSPDWARRRILFYQRWGARPIRCLRRYFMPDFRNPSNRIPMILLDRPFQDTGDLSGDELRSLLTDIYELEYQSVNGAAHLKALLPEVWC